MFTSQRDSRFRPGVVSKLQRRVTLLSALPDDYFRFRSLWCGDNGSARLNDSCFFLRDRKSTRLNSSHRTISYAVFCLKKKNKVMSPYLLQTLLTTALFSIIYN